MVVVGREGGCKLDGLRQPGAFLLFLSIFKLIMMVWYKWLVEREEEAGSCLGRRRGAAWGGGRRGGRRRRGGQRPEAIFAIYCTPNGTKGAPSQEKGKIEEMFFVFKSFLSGHRQVDVFALDITGTCSQIFQFTEPTIHQGTQLISSV